MKVIPQPIRAMDLVWKRLSKDSAVVRIHKDSPILYIPPIGDTFEKINTTTNVHRKSTCISVYYPSRRSQLSTPLLVYHASREEWQKKEKLAWQTASEKAQKKSGCRRPSYKNAVTFPGFSE